MIGRVEDAIIKAVTAATVIDGVPLLKTVESVPHNFDFAEATVRLRLAPAVYVSFLGGPATEETTAAIDAEWALYFLMQNPAGEKGRRRGEDGAYQLLRLVVPAIHGLVVEDVGSLSLGAVNNLFNEQLDRAGLSLYAASFRLPMLFPPLEPKDILALVHADWSWTRELAPPGGEGTAEDDINMRRRG